MNKLLLNKQQEKAVAAVVEFINSPRDYFVLRGSAGTGKTTLLAELIKCLSESHRSVKLLAPTGRAARILRAKTGTRAVTIHSNIYSLKDIKVLDLTDSKNDPGFQLQFPLRTDDPGNTVFIVDEASMVGDKESKQDLLSFGSGKLLSDLIEYSRLGRAGRSKKDSAKIIFVGDGAQLPPVGQITSPALSISYLAENFNLAGEQFELTDVVRQKSGSDVLIKANNIRESIEAQKFNRFSLKSKGQDIVATTLSDSINFIADQQLKKSGSSVLITWENAQALDLNRAVRGKLWGDEFLDLQINDLLLVNKNSIKDGLFNGDLVKVVAVSPKKDIRTIALRGVKKPIELVFREITVAYSESKGSVRRIQCQILENLLDSSSRELTAQELRALLVDFRQRNPELKPKTSEFKLAIKEDPYFNALQVKYGYAMTCHKSQGGEWDTVVVDFSDTRGKRNEDFFRWSYTAITRTKSKLFTISAPEFDPYSDQNWGSVEQEIPSVLVSDIEADQDPDHELFNNSQAILFTYHLKLREKFNSSGIAIVSLEHLSYCERYHLEYLEESFVFDYWYKKSQKISKIRVCKANGEASALATEIESIVDKTLFRDGCNICNENSFINDFVKKIESAITNTQIRVVGMNSLQYRLRIDFCDGVKQVKIDFNYNSKQQWTRVEEVGGVGASNGFLERIRELNF